MQTAAQGKPLYERQPKMAIRTCSYHCSKEGMIHMYQDSLQQQSETSGILVQQSQSLSTAYRDSRDYMTSCKKSAQKLRQRCRLLCNLRGLSAELIQLQEVKKLKPALQVGCHIHPLHQYAICEPVLCCRGLARFFQACGQDTWPYQRLGTAQAPSICTGPLETLAWV